MAVVLVGGLGAGAAAIARPSPPARAFAVWTSPSLHRVGLTDDPSTSTHARIAAARGEAESFQVVVSGGARPVTDVNLRLSDLSGPAGATIGGESIQLFREHYVEVTSSSPDPGGGHRPLPAGTYADALVPYNDPETGAALSGDIQARDASVAAGENQPYWVDVLVPRTATPGTYTGTWTVTSSHGPVEGAVTVTVFDFTLPETPSLDTAFLAWSGRPAVDHELLRNRIMPGSDVADVRGYARDRGLGATNLGFYSGADRSTCAMDAPPPAGTLTARAGAKTVPGVLLYNYTADEIGSCAGLNDRIKEWARRLHEAGALQLITMPPDPALFTDGAGGHGVDIWVVLPLVYDSNATEVGQARSEGMAVWSYLTLVQDSYSPKWLIDFPPIDFRVVPGFINESLGLTGTLYWKVDGWTKDPWHDVMTFEGSYPGEGMLVYPGEAVGLPGGAVPSMRLKWLRDGVDDYDYFTLAKERGLSTQALALAQTVGHDWHTWTKNVAELTTARMQLAHLVEGRPEPEEGATDGG